MLEPLLALLCCHNVLTPSVLTLSFILSCARRHDQGLTTRSVTHSVGGRRVVPLFTFD